MKVKQEVIKIFDEKKHIFVTQAGYPITDSQGLECAIKCVVQTFTDIIQKLSDRIDILEKK